MGEVRLKRSREKQNMHEQADTDQSAYIFGIALRAIEAVLIANADDQGQDSLGISGQVAQLQGSDAQHVIAQIMAMYHRARVTLLHNQPEVGQKLDARVAEALAAVDPDWMAQLGASIAPSALVQIQLGYSAKEL
jgi:hypothetical protein